MPKAVIAGLSEKLSEESCEFKSYKEIGKWVEEKYQISVKYQTLHKQLYYRMKAKLKVPRRSSIKKDKAAGIEFKKTKKTTKSRLVVGVYKPQARRKRTEVLVSR